MGMKKISIMVLISSLLLMTGCGAFHTAKISLKDKTIIYAVANGLEAYYLTDEGTLYSPGADSDASSFVLYQNKDKGVVAENVDTFGTMLNGGYYITRQNELYIWNRHNLPEYNYKNKEGHKKILQDIVFAKIYNSSLIYIDTDGRLWLAGQGNGEIFNLSKPNKLAETVRLADINDQVVFWVEDNGQTGSYGLHGSDMTAFQNIRGVDMREVEMLRITNSSLVFLQNGQLWFYGPYDSLLGKTAGQNELRLLSENILRFACEQQQGSCDQTIVAIDREHIAYVWGKCLSNDASNTAIPVFAYYEKQEVIDNIVQISISGDNLCFVTTDGSTSVFRRRDQWRFCGNSTDDENVGIFREPVKWKD